MNNQVFCCISSMFWCCCISTIQIFISHSDWFKKYLKHMCHYILWACVVLYNTYSVCYIPFCHQNIVVMSDITLLIEHYQPGSYFVSAERMRLRMILLLTLLPKILQYLVMTRMWVATWRRCVMLARPLYL